MLGIILLILVVALLVWVHFSGTKYIKEAVLDESRGFDKLITITYTDGTVERYIGDCTVWKRYPMMKRAGTIMESKLSEIQDYYEEHGNPYPIAHRKNNK